MRSMLKHLEDSTEFSFFHDLALHLVHATEAKPGRLPAFEEVVEDVRAGATAFQRRAALQSLAESLRKSARIERHLA